MYLHIGNPVTSPQPAHGQAPCVDHVTSCDHLNTTIGICLDDHNALTICRSYCGLCDLISMYLIISVWL
jgi:hypothetical protein